MSNRNSHEIFPQYEPEQQPGERMQRQLGGTAIGLGETEFALFDLDALKTHFEASHALEDVPSVASDLEDGR